MHFTYHIKDALFNLASYKMRSSLAMIGILVGTASVVAMVLSVQLATAKALTQFKPLGTNLLTVNIYPNRDNKDTNDELTLEEVQFINTVHTDIKALATYAHFNKKSFFQDMEMKGQLIGVNDAFQPILGLKLQQGRFISHLDQHARYMILGNEVYQSLRRAGHFQVLGEQVRVGNEYYTIIGILQAQHSRGFFFHDINNLLIIPLETVLLTDSKSQIHNLLINMRDGADADMIKKLVRLTLQKYSDYNEIHILSAEEIIEQIKAQSRIFTIILGLIGSISLLVGGIGVMNIMLVSVTERRQEIGIRKAIGARLRDIYGLFLAESVVISLLGGIAGVMLGLLVSYVLAFFSQWDFTVHALPPLVGFSVSVIVGIFFGFYPAYKAAHLTPIKALR